ncbi:MAG: Flp family type IVb pilin [Nitrosomonas sp.]|nr:MAG: Flp family type IVb pilin [Nitrosomonas sp.]
MNKLVKKIKQFIKNEEGMAAVEYALVVAIMAIAISAAWQLLAGGLSGAFTQVISLLSGGTGTEG